MGPRKVCYAETHWTDNNRLGEKIGATAVRAAPTSIQFLGLCQREQIRTDPNHKGTIQLTVAAAIC